MGLKKYFGPATLVTAAFIGPGTVTVCTLAGVNSGYTLLWALGFSIFATIVLQEMAARLGFITQDGLGSAIRKHTPEGFLRILFFFIVISAILIGNAAYEAGNISGGVLGLDLLIGKFKVWPLVIGGIAGIFLFLGKYKHLENLLIGLVILMSLCFIITAILLKPSFSMIAQGFVPSSSADFLTVLALIGTTVVPYNLFLHASSVSEKYKADASLSDIRRENFVSIFLGGLVSMAILIVAATATQGVRVEINSASDMALQLEPVLGSWAKYVMAIGLFAAGISSAITAPLAAAYAARGIFGWEKTKNTIQFKAVWGFILLVGVLFSSLGFKPITIIKFAQIANGLLLPIIAIYLLYMMNKKELLGKHSNSLLQNILGLFVILITLLLSFKILNSVFGFFTG